jgi:type II secretory pathway pseudopilin PulG
MAACAHRGRGGVAACSRGVRRGVRRGVTVFEAAAAMAMVGLVAIGALEAVGANMRAAERSRRAIVAASLAEQRMDWLDFLNETQLRSLPDSVKAGRFDAPLDEYRWTTETAPITTTPGVYDVRIRVTWPDSGAFELRTYVYRRPVITTGRGTGRRG